MSVKTKATAKAIGFKDVLIENKNQSIMIGILLVVWFVILIGTIIGGNVISKKDKQIIDDTARCGKEIAAMRANDNSFTSYYTKDEAVIEFSGTMVDVNKWQKDDELFADFIRPAFDYNDGQEYMQNRYKFKVMLGEDNKFTTLVMGALESYVPTSEEIANGQTVDGDVIYYVPGLAAKDEMGNVTAVTALNASAKTKSSLGSDWFKSYPVSILSEDGSYSYISIIDAAYPGTRGNSGTVKFLASYTITKATDECTQSGCTEEGVHSHLLNFECWPLF